MFGCDPNNGKRREIFEFMTLPVLLLATVLDWTTVPADTLDIVDTMDVTDTLEVVTDTLDVNLDNLEVRSPG